MPWEITPGWNRPAIVVDLHDEVRVARLWRRVGAMPSTLCRRVDDVTGDVLGTWRPGDPAGSGVGRYLSVCMECDKEHWSREPNAVLCVGCEVMVAPNLGR